MPPKLLTTANPKIQKGTAMGYLSHIMHLSPARSSDFGVNLCSHASVGCVKACLHTAGHGGIFKKGPTGIPMTTNTVLEARLRRTKRFVENKELFIQDLRAEVQKAITKARRKGLTPCFRLNGTSDVIWERVLDAAGKSIFDYFPADTIWYDYTKVLRRSPPANLHLTFSRSETNEEDCKLAIAKGWSVVSVYAEVPAGMPSADENDLRFLDPRGIRLGLRAKGRAKKDMTGFVIR